ncbi:hypothetical protein Syun_003100 [Stephania yunnanensis]|uniref:very-long-chain 3-oxoacyl-CoA synthase n=1 Tax=Stephania yunnanensis TaxID=152371 RepID=A0AAP0L242_9MAGN
MEWAVANVRYWLVEHPTVRTFEWRSGRTWGASPLFLATTLFAYVSITTTLRYFIVKSTAQNPSTSPNTSPPSVLRIISAVLRIISAVHSLLLVLISLTMALGCALSTITQAPDVRWIFCFPANHTPPRGPVFFWAYVFYLSKILEFGDTALILLSNSIRRLTFLHVYHHTVVLIMCYVWLEAAQSLVPVALVTNAAVHVVMYLYYAVCALGAAAVEEGRHGFADWAVCVQLFSVGGDALDAFSRWWWSYGQSKRRGLKGKDE